MNDDFDLSTAKPVTDDFDLSTAKPAAPLKTPREQLEAIQPAAPPTPSTLPKGNFLTGTDQAATSLLTGLVGGVAGAVAGAGSRLTGSTMPEAEERAGDIARKLTYEPRSQTGQDYREKAGEVLSALPPVLGVDISLAGPAVSKAVNMARNPVKSLLPTPTPQALELANKAQNFGIPLRPDQLYDSKYMKIYGEDAESFALSGSTKEARQESFNRALANQIGADPSSGKLTPDVFAEAMHKAGKTASDLAETTSINVGKDNVEFRAKSREFANSLEKETPTNQAIVKAYIRDIDSQAKDGVVPGVALKKLISQIRTKMTGTSDGDLRGSLGELKSMLEGELMKGLSKEDQLIYKDAQTKYAKGITMLDLVRKATATEGNISPALLMGQVAKGRGNRAMAMGTGGDMGDLAAIGQRFLKEPASSNTAERIQVHDGLLGAAKRALRYIPANLYNRLGPKVTRALIDAPSTSKTSPSALRGALQSLGDRAPALTGALNRIGELTPGVARRSIAPLSITAEDLRLLRMQQED